MRTAAQTAAVLKRRRFWKNRRNLTAAIFKISCSVCSIYIGATYIILTESYLIKNSGWGHKKINTWY